MFSELLQKNRNFFYFWAQKKLVRIRINFFNAMRAI